MRAQDGDVACWGGLTVPGGLTGIVQVAASDGEPNVACALDGGGAVTCWGDATHPLHNQSGIVELSDGLICGRRADGTVECAGEQPNAADRFMKLGPGYDHQCGIRVDGNIACWGPGNAVNWPPCFAVCEGKVCGDDGCGGSCGDCAAGQTCVEGSCDG